MEKMRTPLLLLLPWFREKKAHTVKLSQTGANKIGTDNFMISCLFRCRRCICTNLDRLVAVLLFGREKKISIDFFVLGGRLKKITAAVTTYRQMTFPYHPHRQLERHQRVCVFMKMIWIQPVFVFGPKRAHYVHWFENMWRRNWK